MKSLFKVSILGLGHSEVVVIRQHVAAILAGSEIDWVGANHDNLDFLIVNSNFINASSIQNLLRNNRVPVLLAGHSVKEDHSNTNTINLPLVENTRLKNWIHESVLSESIVHVQPVQLQELVITQVLSDNAKIFEYLSTTQDGFLHLSDRCGAVGTIDTANQLIHLVPERRVPVDMQGRLTCERLPYFSGNHGSVDLLQWLWDVAWIEPSCAVFVAPNQLVKLKFWPQPSRVNDRKDLLLMSARLGRNVASAQDLVTDLNIPLLRAQHFISALVMVGFAEKYMDVVPKEQSKPDKVVHQEEATGLRRLLLGVRRRLGL
ncbi:MAG: hypothetical protein KGO49_12015 [Gammaproteobacteria bacterium]|nr:hypothetical protein [Gammaproteobacteria bacterium]